MFFKTGAALVVDVIDAHFVKQEDLPNGLEVVLLHKNSSFCIIPIFGHLILFLAHGFPSGITPKQCGLREEWKGGFHREILGATPGEEFRYVTAESIDGAAQTERTTFPPSWTEIPKAFFEYLPKRGGTLWASFCRSVCDCSGTKKNIFLCCKIIRIRGSAQKFSA